MATRKLNFTKSAIANLPLPEPGKRSHWYDMKVPGLELRITSSGVKSFSLYRKIDGRAERVFLGRFPSMTPEQARARAGEFNSQIAAGRNPAREKRGYKVEMTLQVLFERFLEIYAKQHKRTWRYDEQMYEHYFSPWGQRKISSIRQDEVQVLHARIGKEHGVHAANRAFSFLHSLYSKAEQWGYEGRNPVHKLKRFQVQSRDRFLQKEELPRFFEAVTAEPNATVRDFLLLSLFTGQRRSNVLSMSWDQISFDLALWNISGDLTKNKEPHTVPLTRYAFNILEQRKSIQNTSPWVFPSPRLEGHIYQPKEAWARILTQAELEDVRFHDLRRTLGAWMAITGASLLIISQCLGHKVASSHVTGVYARLSLEPVREAMEKACREMALHGKYSINDLPIRNHALDAHMEEPHV
mgnify:CR=1 FL=1